MLWTHQFYKIIVTVPIKIDVLNWYSMRRYFFPYLCLQHSKVKLHAPSKQVCLMLLSTQGKCRHQELHIEKFQLLRKPFFYDIFSWIQLGEKLASSDIRSSFLSLHRKLSCTSTSASFPLQLRRRGKKTCVFRN